MNTVQNLSVAFGSQTLFEEVDVSSRPETATASSAPTAATP
jgi:hypothetical protein